MFKKERPGESERQQPRPLSLNAQGPLEPDCFKVVL